METPEKKSEFAKRVLFGASKAAALAAVGADKQDGGGTSTRSGSQSSTSSAPYSVPGTPKGHATSIGPSSTPFMGRTPGKASTANNAALSVFLRVRPPGVPDADVDKLTGRRTYQILDDQATLRTFPPLSAGHSRTINRQAKDFGFTKVFSSDAGQAETYEATMRPLVDDVFASQNALLFAYGMTNAGKTYTVLGEDGSPGLIPQALTDTFERVAQMGADDSEEVRVEMSFLEIYIENVYDLLAAADADDWAKARTALKLDDRMGVIQARDLSKHVIKSAADGLDLVRRATANRRVASTRLNEDSSRSHSVCMIKLVREKGKDSSLWVVDLAGSERSGRTGAGATSTRQKEANNINKSLSTLWHCLTIMRANLRKDEPETRVPFRESKLTHLFKNHLQGPAAGKTVMVVNINPSTADFDETQQVLKNSTIAREVKTVKDDSAANRQNGLIHTPYGFNGRKMVVKKPQASRRSIHQAVAPKLEGLGPPPPRQNAAKSPKRVECSHGDTDCGSDGDAEPQATEAGGGGEGGYMSGAESDSGLVDTRQSMNLVVRNLQVDNAALKTKLKSTLANKKKKEAAGGHRPISGGPLEQYINLLEEKVSSAEARMEEMRKDHQAEVQDLEDEFESFVAENDLNAAADDAEPRAVPSSEEGADPALLERLREEVRVANLQADQWKKEAETLRSRLHKREEAQETGHTTRSPLRQSTGSTGQGRVSLENRQDGENSPPGQSKTIAGTLSHKPKVSALLTTQQQQLKKKKKKASSSGGAPPLPDIAITTTTPQQESSSPTVTATTSRDGTAATEGESSRRGSGVSDKAASGKGSGLRTPRDSRESGGCWGGKGKVVVAVSRRVSVLRVSTANGRRISSVRASLANGRRASRASYAAGTRRVSQLARSRASVANANASGNPGDGGDGANTTTTTTPVKEGEEEGGEGYEVAGGRGSGGGMGSRRESAMTLAAQQEENFFEKARRCVLRAMGVGRKSTLGRPGSAGSSRDGTYTPIVAETAAEIALRHKIKVKMPKRPCKKAMEGTAKGAAKGAGALGAVNPLWRVKHEGNGSFEEEEDDDEDDEEEEEEEVASPNRTSSSAVMTGIERWVFGGKQERTTPIRTPTRSKVAAAAAKAKVQSSAVREGAATGEVSPLPGTTTMHDYVRAM